MRIRITYVDMARVFLGCVVDRLFSLVGLFGTSYILFSWLGKAISLTIFLLLVGWILLGNPDFTFCHRGRTAPWCSRVGVSKCDIG